MKTAEDGILSFAQVLVGHPQEVVVKQIDGDPIVFEITVLSKDLVKVSSKYKEIETIAANASGLQQGKFVLKFIEG